MPKSEVNMETGINCWFAFRRWPTSFGWKGILLSFQRICHVWCIHLAPFGSWECLYQVPFCIRCRNTIYMISTGFKVPVIWILLLPLSQLCHLPKENGGDASEAHTGVILTGFVYVLLLQVFDLQVQNGSTNSLPPIVIGPMIIVIGLGLAGSAVTNAGLVADGNWKNALVARCYFLDCCLYQYKRKRLPTNHPIPFAIIGGYLFALALDWLTLLLFLKLTGLKSWFLPTIQYRWCLQNNTTFTSVLKQSPSYQSQS